MYHKVLQQGWRQGLPGLNHQIAQALRCKLVQSASPGSQTGPAHQAHVPPTKLIVPPTMLSQPHPHPTAHRPSHPHLHSHNHTRATELGSHSKHARVITTVVNRLPQSKQCPRACPSPCYGHRGSPRIQNTKTQGRVTRERRQSLPSEKGSIGSMSQTQTRGCHISTLTRAHLLVAEGSRGPQGGAGRRQLRLQGLGVFRGSRGPQLMVVCGVPWWGGGGQRVVGGRQRRGACCPRVLAGRGDGVGGLLRGQRGEEAERVHRQGPEASQPSQHSSSHLLACLTRCPSAQVTGRQADIPHTLCEAC